MDVLVGASGDFVIIDRTNASMSDYRFDLAWTLVLLESYLGSAASRKVLTGYMSLRRESVDDFAFFEVAAAARRLFDIAVSLKHGPEALGMQAVAADAMNQDARTAEVPMRKIRKLTRVQLNPTAAPR